MNTSKFSNSSLAVREARIGWRIAIVLSALSVASLIAWAAAEWCNVPRIDGVDQGLSRSEALPGESSSAPGQNGAAVARRSIGAGDRQPDRAEAP